MKKCTKCEMIKPLNKYEYQRNECKDCRNNRKKELSKNKVFEVTLESRCCRVCKIIKAKEEFSIARQKFGGIDYDCRTCRNATLKKRYENNKEYIKQKNNEYYYANKEVVMKKALIRQKERLKTDRMYLLSRRLRNRLYCALKTKNWKKHTKFALYIGCDSETLVNHIQVQFKDGMSWDNQGQWHIDHIIALDSATTEEELHKLCHYTNLQPMWALDNIRKGIS